MQRSQLEDEDRRGPEARARSGQARTIDKNRRIEAPSAIRQVDSRHLPLPVNLLERNGLARERLGPGRWAHYFFDGGCVAAGKANLVRLTPLPPLPTGFRPSITIHENIEEPQPKKRDTTKPIQAT